MILFSLLAGVLAFYLLCALFLLSLRLPQRAWQLISPKTLGDYLRSAGCWLLLLVAFSYL